MALSRLPPELLQHIGRYLGSWDLSSFSRTNRLLHWRLSYPLFDWAIERRLKSSQDDNACLVSLFFHAVAHDSIHIVQYLYDCGDRINLKGPIRNDRSHHAFARSIQRSRLSRLPSDFTFLHVALLADAPNVTVFLVNNGADINRETEDYPDLTPLYMVLPKSLATAPAKYDSALRIACNYALPRIATLLLASGADANTRNSFGVAAIHTTVMRRHPWQELSLIYNVVPGQRGHCNSRWESMLLRTVSALLDFGADVHLQSQASRIHECAISCWRSIDCEHPNQTALHFASANNMQTIVSRLIDAGADPDMPDAQGYTALYCALVQGHKDVACLLLKHTDDDINPIVNTKEQITALHVACRFSFEDMVYRLLDYGADANATDSQGRTPLHDVLTWFTLEREQESWNTLDCLIAYDADPNITTYRLSPRQIAGSHPSKRVRDKFSSPRKSIQIRPAKSVYSSRSTTKAPNREVSGRADRITESSTPPRGPVPRQIDFNLEHSVWAPDKTINLVRNFQASPKQSKQKQTKVAQEPFPNLTTKSGFQIHPAGSPGGIWSETGTTRIIRDLEFRTPPAISVKQPSQPLETYPELRRAAESGTGAVVRETLSAEATQFWGKMTRNRDNSRSEIAADVKAGSTTQNSEKTRKNVEQGKNRRRWTRLGL